MKTILSLLLLTSTLAALGPGTAFAQDRIYRCGNEYTNNATDAQKRGCKLVEGGNVTVIEGTKPTTPPAASRAVTAPPGSPRVDSSDQRARDNEARSILEAELRKAEQRRTELLAEYNNGEPERRGEEARNYQKYLDRVADLKASITRTESDIAGLKRELGRMPTSR